MNQSSPHFKSGRFMLNEKTDIEHFEQLKKEANKVLQNENLTEYASENFKRILNELENHRSELEMQNEKLRQAREELETAKNRYLRLYDYAPVGYLTLDKSGLVNSANKTFALMIKSGTENLSKKSFSSFLAESSKDDFYKILYARDKNTAKLELKRSDGSSFWAVVQLDSELNKDDEISEFWCTVTDITKQHKIEQDLLESKNQIIKHLNEIETIYKFTQVGLCELDLEYRYVRINDYLAAINGRPVEEHIGKRVWEIVPKLKDHIQETGNKVHQTGKPVKNIPLTISKNEKRKSLRHLLVHWYPLKYYNQIDSFNIVVEDVTEQKRIVRRLERERKVLHSIVDSIPVMLVIWDKNFEHFQINKECERLLGWTHEDFRHLNVMESIYPDPVYRQEVADFMQNLDPFWKEIRLVTKSGEIIDTSWTNVALTENLCIGIGLDIRSQKQAELELRKTQKELEQRVQERTAELNTSNQELKQRSEQLSRLTAELTMAEQRERQRIADILHDQLQQMLSVAKINIGALQSSISKDHPSIESAKEVEKLLSDSIDALRDLTYQLYPPILYKIGLGTALEWLVEDMRNKHKLNIEIEHNLPDNALSKPIREFMFQSAKELVYNIVKHAESKNVSIRVEKGKNSLTMTVKDAGKGFDPATVQIGSKEAKGFGLFSITERARYLQGKMEIDSAPGKGSKFEITIPIALKVKSEQSVTIEKAEQLEEQKMMDNKKPLRILIVDDHNLMREGLTFVISKETDMEVIGEAANGEQGLKMAHELNPDVVIMDVSMPVMNGIVATTKLRAEMQMLHIVGLTMHNEKVIHDQMKNAGANVCLSKSEPTDRFLSAIRACRNA